MTDQAHPVRGFVRLPPQTKTQDSAQTGGGPAASTVARMLAREAQPTALVKADHPTDPKRYADGTVKPGVPIPQGMRNKGVIARMDQLVDFNLVLTTLASIVYGDLAPLGKIADRVKAAQVLLDRRYGRAPLNVKVTTDDKGRATLQHVPTADLVDMVKQLRAVKAASKAIDRPDRAAQIHVQDATLVDDDGNEIADAE